MILSLSKNSAIIQLVGGGGYQHGGYSAAIIKSGASISFRIFLSMIVLLELLLVSTLFYVLLLCVYSKFFPLIVDIGVASTRSLSFFLPIVSVTTKKFNFSHNDYFVSHHEKKVT